ncbi:hypothetical protein SSAG_04987 [Streptomyces sp. Mg1]|nr:hypothetical protein SSAG_04987 [Streptomyces sp. Mg1]
MKRSGIEPRRWSVGVGALAGAGGRLGPHHQLQLRALLDPARPHRRQGLVPGRRRRAVDHGPHQIR